MTTGIGWPDPSRGGRSVSGTITRVMKYRDRFVQADGSTSDNAREPCLITRNFDKCGRLVPCDRLIGMFQIILFGLLFLSIDALGQNALNHATSPSDIAVATTIQQQERLKLERESFILAREQLEVSRSKEVRDAWKDWAAFGQSLITAISIALAGGWVFLRFVWGQERYPNIEFTADINILGTHQDWLIAELIANIENKGKIQHQMRTFQFWLDGISGQDPVNIDERWGGQVDFPQTIAQGSFLPGTSEFFFVDAGTRSKYSWIARVPRETRFLLLHCSFEYCRRGRTGHTAERSMQIPEICEGY